MSIKIIKAKKKHAGEIIRLINELADFEKLDPPDDDARKRLIKDAFGKNPLIHILLAKDEESFVGYAIYFFSYSSFLAKKTLYLEDIFISESRRRSGIGMFFFKKLENIAKKKNCGRMEWCVLDWNLKAIAFYENIGARQLNNWIYYRKVMD
ncbi:GNAT family N-acetyltransferase [soil metagenome]